MSLRLAHLGPVILHLVLSVQIILKPSTFYKLFYGRASSPFIRFRSKALNMYKHPFPFSLCVLSARLQSGVVL